MDDLGPNMEQKIICYQGICRRHALVRWCGANVCSVGYLSQLTYISNYATFMTFPHIFRLYVYIDNGE